MWTPAMRSMYWTSLLLWAGALTPLGCASPWNIGLTTSQGTVRLCGRNLATAVITICRGVHSDEWLPETETTLPPPTHLPTHETTMPGSHDQNEHLPPTNTWAKPSTWENLDSWDKPSSWEELDSWDKPSSWEELESWDKPSSWEKPESREEIGLRGKRVSEVYLRARSKRDLVTECCHKACSIQDLILFC